MKSHPKLSLTLSVIFGIIAAACILQALFYIIGDIQAGALKGTPETGWGFMIAIVFFGPIILVSGLISFFSFRSYRRAMNQPVATTPDGLEQTYEDQTQIVEQPQQQTPEQPQPLPEQPQSVSEPQQSTTEQQ